MSYRDMLRDPRWQRRRLEILARDGWQCRCCGNAQRELHVHHRRYRSGVAVWDYSGSDLVTLCKACHERIEVAVSNCREYLPLLTANELADALRLLSEAFHPELTRSWSHPTAFRGKVA